MSLVTCIPFGLAIRDTLRGDEPRAATAPTPQADELYPQVEAHQAEADRVEEARHADEAAAERERARARLFGPAPVTLGEMFNGQQIGSKGNGSADTALPAQLEDAMVDGSLDVIGGKIVAVHLTLLEDCEKLRGLVADKWGPPEDDAWLDPTNHRRAKIYDCHLEIESYVDAAAWVKALPLGLVGTKADVLRDSLGDMLVPPSDSDVTWRDRAPGPAGAGMTSYEAAVDNGKVVKLTVSATVGAATGAQIRAELTRRLGQPKADPDTGVLTFKSRPPVQLDGESGAITISVGTLP